MPSRLVVLLFFALAACQHQRARLSVTTISADNHELRDAFDADADKVRIIMLVSPS
jgi:hypothetical protein